jgi:uncharacterized protein YndB with AHSA1/START domain
MEHTITISKEIISPRDTTFNAFTQPDELSRWFTTDARGNPVPGEKYSNADNDEGEYIEVNPSEKVSFTWENKEHCPGTFVEVEFTEESPGKTIVTLKHSKLPDEAGAMDMKKGWTWALTSLKSYLEEGKSITYNEWEKDNPDLNLD